MANPQIFPPAEQAALEALPFPFSVSLLEPRMDRFLVLSDGLCELLGLTRKEIMAKASRDAGASFLASEDVQKYREVVDYSLLNPGKDFAVGIRFKKGKGKYLALELRGKSTLSPFGLLLYVTYSPAGNDDAVQKDELLAANERVALLSKILDTTQTKMFWKDASRRFLGVNKAFLDYYGFKSEWEVLGKTDEEMGWHPDPSKFEDDEIAILKEGKSTSFVLGKCLVKGEIRDITASKSPVYSQGKIVGLVGSFDDVTLQKKQSEEIRSLNEKISAELLEHQAMMDASEVAIVKCLLDENLTVAEYNAAAARIFGYGKEEFAATFHSHLREAFHGPYQRSFALLKQRIETALSAQEKKISLRLEIPAKTGPIWIDGAGNLVSDAQGKPLYLYAIFRDVGPDMELQKELDQAQLAAHESETLTRENQRLQDLINAMPTGLCTLRFHQGVAGELIANEYFAEHLGLPYEKGQGYSLNKFLSLIHPADQEECQSDYARLLQEKTPMSSEYRFQNQKTGLYSWLGVRSNAVKLPEGDEIIYFVFSDIDEMKNAELRLRQSRHLYHQAVTAAQLILFEYDIASHTITMSEDDLTKDYCAKFSVPKRLENVPSSLRPYFDKDDYARLAELFNQADSGISGSCSAWNLPGIGIEARCEKITLTVSFNAAGKAAKAYGIGQNITAERKVEERYLREMEYLRNASSQNLLGKGRYNLSINQVVEYESKLAEPFLPKAGENYDEAIARFIASISPEERAMAKKKMSRESLLRSYQEGDMNTSFQFHRKGKDQRALWVNLSIHTHLMPETGNVEAFTYSYDISEEKLSEQVMSLLSDQEFDYIGLLYLKTGNFEFLKRSGTIRFPEPRTLTPYETCQEYVRTNFVNEDELGQYDKATTLSNILIGLNENNGHFSTTYHRSEEGTIYCKQVDYVWFDKTHETILMMRSDITPSYLRDQAQMEKIEAAKLEAEKANEAKSTFLSSMSHDIRTPLNGVIGFTQIAQSEKDPAKVKDYLSKIQSSGELLLDLVNDTLDLSRIESEKVVLEPEAIEVKDLVEEVVTALKPGADLKKITLTVNRLAEDEVWVDKIQCQKIILNLLSNAIKYTPSNGHVNLSFKAVSGTNSGHLYQLIVQDDGIGMSPEFLERIYEPFSQEHRKEASGVTGTGLGMALVKRIVTLLGGDIQVDSVMTKGTKFTVNLPLSNVQKGKEEARHAEKAVLSLKGKRVLLCEDNRINAEITTIQLHDKGIEVVWKENGQDGVASYEGEAPYYFDAILMDIRMPVMDGMSATKAIRASGRLDAESIPIIALTGDAFAEDIEKCLAVGMNAHLAKPIDPQKMFSTISSLIANKK